MTLSDPDIYEYSPYNNRPKITWPNGSRVAFWVAPNIEFYETYPPENPVRKDMSRPAPDVVFYSHRDYGNRTGVWRMMEAMDRYGVRGSVSLNVAVCDHHPEIILEWGKVTVSWWSHKIKGLHKNDFICASKTDNLFKDN